MKKSLFRDTSGESLEDRLKEKRAALRSFRFESAGSKARNVREGRSIRRDIARIITELKRRQSEN